MIKALIKKIGTLSNSPWYWLVLIVTGISLLAVALYYQYVLDELPCITCIHIRLWVAALVIISVLGLVARKNIKLSVIANMSMLGIAIALVDRSYLLLGTERGFIFADCGFTLGLPDWFAVEAWMPWLFQVETSCGYTPELVFGITMAEALIVFSVALFLMSLSVFVVSVLHAARNR